MKLRQHRVCWGSVGHVRRGLDVSQVDKGGLLGSQQGQFTNLDPLYQRKLDKRAFRDNATDPSITQE